MQSFQQSSTLQVLRAACRAVGVSAFSFKISSTVFRWCCHLRALKLLIETSWNRPSVKPVWSVSSSDPETWEYCTGLESEGQMLLCFSPPNLPKPLCPLNTESCHRCLCSLPSGLSGRVLGAVNLRSTVSAVAVYKQSLYCVLFKGCRARCLQGAGWFPEELISERNVSMWCFGRYLATCFIKQH